MTFKQSLLLVLLIAVAPRTAGACSCALPDLSEKGVADAVAQADAVFKGEVIHVEALKVPDFGEPHGFNAATMVIFHVSGYWKGPEALRIAVFTGDGHSDCGQRFAVGESWMIFAHYSYKYVPGALNTSMCGLGTRLPDRRGVEAKLGKAKLPPPLLSGQS